MCAQPAKPSLIDKCKSCQKIDRKAYSDETWKLIRRQYELEGDREIVDLYLLEEEDYY